MRPYFEKMKEFGRELKPGQIKSTQANVGKLKEVDELVEAAAEKVKPTSVPAAPKAEVATADRGMALDKPAAAEAEAASTDCSCVIL